MARPNLAQSAQPLRDSMTRAERTGARPGRSLVSRVVRIVLVAGLALVTMLVLTSAAVTSATPDARDLMTGAMAALTLVATIGGIVIGSRW